ncbi:facilitated trehalose transporter Tret1-like isoform X1 [Nymphalis io]|uniref:facilitated trehalose transporter Tret1-like isoform X1 n=1 Tax=Inachis io TaxID=171585 RepID=UPI002168920F|nr:facilitated trehalose transporter Tret1-like isoform X1 [Nymphalis io]
MYFKITGIKRQVLISAVLYLGQILLGFSVSWSGPIFPKLRDPTQSPLPYLLTEIEMSLIASFVYIGGLPGPYIMGWLSNIYGRKPCLIVGGVLSFLAYIILVWAKNLAMLYCGRLLIGLGIGIIAVMNLVYIGEIASSNIRGILLSALGIFTTCGSILMYSAGSFLPYSYATSVGLASSLAFTVFAMFIPESPIFHVLEDNEDEAKAKLKDLGREGDIDNILQSKIEYINSTNKKDWIELVTLRSNRRALLIVVVINILQHGSGIFAVISFSGSIFEMSGSSIGSDISMLIIGFFQLIGSTTAPFFVEKNGRKSLLVVSTIICSLSMLLLGLYFYLDYLHYSGINYVHWLPLVLLIIFFIGYDAGLGIVPNVLIGEMFTMNVRSKGSAVALSFSWVSGFLVTLVYGALVENIGSYAAFWFFSCAGLIACFFTIFCIPETKGKSLLEVQDMLKKK